MQHTVKIIEKSWLTHDALCLRLERPLNYSFYAGQAIEVSLENPRFQGENAPFTLTGLSSEKNLELIAEQIHDQLLELGIDKDMISISC